MQESISHSPENKTNLAAWVEGARVSIEALCSDDVASKLNTQRSECLASDPEEEFTRCLFEAEVPVLGFSEELLRVDGYMACRLLEALREQTGRPWFIFGTFGSENGKRYHIVLPREQVPRCLAVLEWKVLEWTTKRIHQF